LLIYHFDFYRIEDEIEAYDFGCDEYLNSGNYCFLEWAERIPNLIPEQALVVTLSEEENGCRIISF
jgi:tRNA threonylcarbamoyladenosine biosynthesis protein TsaE